MKKIFTILLILPNIAFGAFSGVTPASPVNTDASGVMTCYPYVYAYNGSVGRTYIAATEAVDFSGSGIYNPPITNDGEGRFLKDTEHTSDNPPSQEDWDDYSTDYNTSDTTILDTWYNDNGVSNISICDTPIPDEDESLDESIAHIAIYFNVRAIMIILTIAILLGVALNPIRKVL